MPKPRKRRTTISSEEKAVKDEENVIDSQRSNADADIQKTSELTSSNDVNSPAAKRVKLGKVKDRQYDKYCWICHKEECEQRCSLCPRIYHIQCVNRHEVCEEDWMCPECLTVSLSDKKSSTSPILAMLTTEQFCSLLKYTLHRMKIHVPEDFNIDNSNSVVYPMDFNILEKNIRKKAYTTTASFLADVKWILHNHIISSSHGMPVIKTILKVCQEELREIETCPDCYLHAYSMKDKWFSEPCRKPHTLVWAKLKGFPIWPAKAVKSANGNVDVRFFGGHERAWVPVGHVYFLTRDPPQAITSQKKNFEIAIQEVDLHIKLLTQRFGGYEYALEKIPFIPTQLYLHLNITLNKLCCNPQSSRDKRKYDMPPVSSKRRSSKSQETQGIKKDGQKKEDTPEQESVEQDVLEKIEENETSSVIILDTKPDIASEEIIVTLEQNTSLIEVGESEVEKSLTSEVSNVLVAQEDEHTSKIEGSIEKDNSESLNVVSNNKTKSNDIINSEINEQFKDKENAFDKMENSEILESKESNMKEVNCTNVIPESSELAKFRTESNLSKETVEIKEKSTKSNLNSKVVEESEDKISINREKSEILTENLNKSLEESGNLKDVTNSENSSITFDNSLDKTKSEKSHNIEKQIIQNNEKKNTLTLHEKSNIGFEEKKLSCNKESENKSSEFSNISRHKENNHEKIKINRKETSDSINLSNKSNEVEPQKHTIVENGSEKESIKHPDVVENDGKTNSDPKETPKSQSPNSLRIRIVKGKVESKSDLQEHSIKTSSVKSNKPSKKCEFTISRSNSSQNNSSSHKEKSSIENHDNDNSKSKTESVVPSLAVRKSKRPRKNFIIQFPWKILSKSGNSDEDVSKTEESLSDSNQTTNGSENKSADAIDSLNSSKEQKDKTELSSDKEINSTDLLKSKESLSKLSSLESKSQENIKDSPLGDKLDSNAKSVKNLINTDELKVKILEDTSKNKVLENNQESSKIQISKDVELSKTQITENNVDPLKVKLLENNIDLLRPQVILDNIDSSKNLSSQVNIDLSKKQTTQNSSDLSKSSETSQDKCLKNIDLPTNITAYQSKQLESIDVSKDKVIQIKSFDSVDLIKTTISQSKSTDLVDSIKTTLLQDKNTVPSNSVKTVIVLDKFMDKSLDSNSLKNKITQEKKLSNYTGKSKFVHPSTILEKLDKVKIAKSPIQLTSTPKKQDSIDVQKTTVQSVKTNNSSSVFSHIAKILGQPPNTKSLNSSVTASVKSPAISVVTIPKSTENIYESCTKKSVQIFSKSSSNLNTTQASNLSNQEIETDHCNDLDMECINEEENSIRKAMDSCMKDSSLSRQEVKINNTQLSIQNVQPSVKYNTTPNIRNETNSVASTSQGESTQNSRQSSCANEKNLFNILPVEKYARKLTVFLTNTLEEMCQDIINSGCMQVAIHSLEKEIENLQEKHKKEMLDVKQNTDLIVKEMRSTIETEKQNAITEVRRQCEIEMRKNIEETKKKQWCANCGKEAVFYCCWNTSYCDYPCQQAHWPQHMSTCGQNHVTTVKEQLVTNMPNLGPEMTITQSPAIHSNLPVRIQFAGLHNQTQISQQTNKQKNKKKCQFPVDQMTARRKNGNLNLSQSPTASIQQTDVRLSPHPSTQILGANYTLQGGQVIPVSLQHNTPHPKQCAPTSTIEMKSHTVHPMSFPFNPHVCM